MGPQIRIKFGWAQARVNIRPYSSFTLLKLDATHQRRRRVSCRPVHTRECPPRNGFRHDAVLGPRLLFLGNPHSLVFVMSASQFRGSVSCNCICFGRVQYRNIQALNGCNLLTYVLLVTVLSFRSLALYVGLVRSVFVQLWRARQMLAQLFPLPSSAVQEFVSAVALASIRRDSSIYGRTAVLLYLSWMRSSSGDGE